MNATNSTPNPGPESQREPNLTERLATFRKKVEEGVVHTLEPLLPLVLSLKGKPYTLRDHFPFAPLFRTRMSYNLCVKSGRQVAKSTTISGNGVIVANCIPYFNTLYVTPLYDQVRRLSNNFVREFIDGSPIKTLWTGTTTENAVQQRSFKNRSKLFFSFALLDAERIRGYSADRIIYDESFSGSSSYVTTRERGAVLIKDVEIGETVLSFTENGKLVWSKVLNKSYHGRRRCYRLIAENGRFVDATSESYVATAAGWSRVSKIIEDAWESNRPNQTAKPTADAVGTGDDARGRQYNGSRCAGIRSRIATNRIHLDQVHLLVRVRTRTTLDIEEEQARLRVNSVLDCGNADIYLLARDDVSGRREDCYETVAGHDRRSRLLAKRSLVDSGRRVADQTKRFVQFDDLHTRLPTPRSRTAARLVDRTRLQVQDQRCASEGLPSVSNTDIRCASIGQVDERPTTMDAAVDAVQARHIDKAGRADLHVLRREVRSNRDSETHQSITSAVLREAGMPAGKEASGVNDLRDAGEAKSSTGKADKPVSQRSRIQRENPDFEPQIQRKTPGNRKEGQEALQRQSQGRTRGDNTNLLVLRKKMASRTARTPGSICLRRLLAGRLAVKSKANPNKTNASQTRFVKQASNHIDRAVERGDCLVSTKLKEIQDVGEHDVYDLEIEDTHTMVINDLAWSNCQDLDPQHLPIVKECMSASKWGIQWFTGTPKTLDNNLEQLWQRSSQAEWFMRCTNPGCNHWNIPAAEYGIMDMIGPLHDDIGETEFNKKPAIVCCKCRKPLNPRDGRWVHRYPDRRWDFAGYHIPQIIMPMHYASRKKWAELLAKQRGVGNTTPAMFQNEVLGESCEFGVKLVTKTDLINAATLPWANDPLSPESIAAKANLNSYAFRCLAVDWGGGGEEEISFTTLAVLGFHGSGRIDVLWGKRSLDVHDPIAEAALCLRVFNSFKCHFLAHDYTGAGSLRETFIVHAGLSLDRVIPVMLCRTGQKDIMSFHPGSEHAPRDYWLLDKARSLQLTAQCIKFGYLRSFQYDFINADEAGLLHDWLALMENKVPTPHAGDIYTIIRNPAAGPDDFAQAVNIGCCALWHTAGAWPNTASLAGLQVMSTTLPSVIQPVNSAQMEIAAPSAPWVEQIGALGADSGMEGFFGMPGSDFF